MDCTHCGRTMGDTAGGYAAVGDSPLCHPNVPDRPDCYSLVTVHGETLGARRAGTVAPYGGQAMPPAPPVVYVQGPPQQAPMQFPRRAKTGMSPGVLFAHLFMTAMTCGLWLPVLIKAWARTSRTTRFM